MSKESSIFFTFGKEFIRRSFNAYALFESVVIMVIVGAIFFIGLSYAYKNLSTHIYWIPTEAYIDKIGWASPSNKYNGLYTIDYSIDGQSYSANQFFKTTNPITVIKGLHRTKPGETIYILVDPNNKKSHVLNTYVELLVGLILMMFSGIIFFFVFMHFKDLSANKFESILGKSIAKRTQKSSHQKTPTEIDDGSRSVHRKKRQFEKR